MHRTLIAFILFSTLTTFAQKPPSSCVPLFSTEESRFNICLHQTCLIFRTEKPFVFAEGLNTATDSAPFRCRERRKHHPALSGVFFSILDEIPALSDAHCIWAGPDCTFDSMIHFVGNTSMIKRYKFAAGGLLFLLRYRISEHTIASAPLLDDHLVVLGPRKSREGVAEVLDTAIKPFASEAWALLAACLALLILIRIIIAVQFTDPLTTRNFIANLFGDNDTMVPRFPPGDPPPCGACMNSKDCVDCKTKAEQVDDYRKRQKRMHALNLNLSKATRIFWMTAVLFFEIAVVNFIFKERSTTLISELIPQRFAAIKDSTEEHIMRKILSSGRFDSSEGLPWNRSADVDELYRTIVFSNPPKYTMVYEKFNQFKFRDDSDLCTKQTIYHTYTPLPSFPGVWYYGSQIKLPERTKIDQEIAELRERGRIREILTEVIGTSLPARCKERSNIGVVHLALPMIIFVGPFLLYELYLAF